MKKEYVYYCDDCKCFVKENHRCQQWETVYIIPQEAIDMLIEKAHNNDYVNENKSMVHNSWCSRCGRVTRHHGVVCSECPPIQIVMDNKTEEIK